MPVSNDKNLVFEIIKKRRSVRKFKNIPVEDEKILKLIEAARLAPSATNRQPWRFIVVKSKELLLEISSSALGIINTWAKSAPLLIVCCAVKKSLLTHYMGERLSRIPYHIMDVAIAAEHIVLEAEELGLSSCWIGWFSEKKIRKILDIPPGWKIVAILAVGYKDESYTPKPQKRLPLKDILIIK
ncbi:MAG: nitroreductase family protein [Actinobacteria bacterium]|nr:nitroreductase family protein [Actinomycetota bacterium]